MRQPVPMPQPQPQQAARPEPELGERRTTVDGINVIWDGSNWVEVRRRQGSSAMPGNEQFNRSMARQDAEAFANARVTAAGAIPRAAEGEALLRELPNTPTGFLAGTRMELAGTPFAGKFGIPTREQAARMRQIDTYGSQGVITNAQAIKPVSASDITFLQSMEAGSSQNQESNRRYIITRQWFDAKNAGAAQAMQAWTAQLGSPSATNAQGQDFYSWWELYSANAYPRPNFDGFGASHPANTFTGYRPPRQPRGGAQAMPPGLELSPAMTLPGGVAAVSDANAAGQREALTPAARNAFSRIPGGFNPQAAPGSMQRPFYLGDRPESTLQVGQYGITADGRLVEGRAPRPVATGGRRSNAPPLNTIRPPAEQQAPVRVQTVEEANRLPPGTRYITPDGQEFTR